MPCLLMSIGVLRSSPRNNFQCLIVRSRQLADCTGSLHTSSTELSGSPRRPYCDNRQSSATPRYFTFSLTDRSLNGSNRTKIPEYLRSQALCVSSESRLFPSLTRVKRRSYTILRALRDTTSPSRSVHGQSQQIPTTSSNGELPVASSKIHSSGLPLDAASQVSGRARSLPHSLKRILTTYLSLSKPRLTFLMVLTAASAYSLYPMPSVLFPTATESPSLSALTLIYLTTGTGLCSAAANSLNMMMEPDHDAKMSRTRNRPLVRGLISKRGALLFALATGTAGIVGLYLGVNSTVSFLGGLSIFLYAGVYTPLKRISVINTWVGAVVGAIPPLMGWAAGAGQCAVGDGDWRELLFGTNATGGWLLATLLFAWQFHHFNALSWTVRHEYKYAGYRMLAWVNEAMNARVALRYALLCFPACWGLSFVGVTDSSYILTSSIVNAWIARAAWQFYRKRGAGGSARGLFWAGVWQLPVLMVLAMAQKKGLWDRLWRSLTDDSTSEDEVIAEEVHRSAHGVATNSKGHKSESLALRS